MFRAAVSHEKSPLEQIKINVVPFHKTGNKETLKSFRQVSLLLICGNVLAVFKGNL